MALVKKLHLQFLGSQPAPLRFLHRLQLLIRHLQHPCLYVIDGPIFIHGIGNWVSPVINADGCNHQYYHSSQDDLPALPLNPVHN